MPMTCPSRRLPICWSCSAARWTCTRRTASELTPAGARSPLAAVAPDQPVLHWHGDTFDLPPGATLLASTGAYAQQAFSAGPNLLALQFHLEAGGGIERWLTGHAQELAGAGIDPQTIREGAARNAALLEAVSRRTLLGWLSQLEER